MMPPLSFYCIDTISILQWFVDSLSSGDFSGLQNRIEQLIAAGRLRSPKAVLDEIKPGDDCHTWCKAQAELFVEDRLECS